MRKLIVGLIAGALFGGFGLAEASAAATQTGYASYYTMGRKTANGERYNPMGLTAAHRTLPFGTVVRITSLKNGRSVVVRINDRGPFVRSRIIDLSFGAARALGINRSGIGRITMLVLN